MKDIKWQAEILVNLLVLANFAKINKILSISINPCLSSFLFPSEKHVIHMCTYSIQLYTEWAVYLLIKELQ